MDRLSTLGIISPVKFSKWGAPILPVLNWEEWRYEDLWWFLNPYKPSYAGWNIPITEGFLLS